MESHGHPGPWHPGSPGPGVDCGGPGPDSSSLSLRPQVNSGLSARPRGRWPRPGMNGDFRRVRRPRPGINGDFAGGGSAASPADRRPAGRTPAQRGPGRGDLWQLGNTGQALTRDWQADSDREAAVAAAVARLRSRHFQPELRLSTGRRSAPAPDRDSPAETAWWDSDSPALRLRLVGRPGAPRRSAL